MLIIHPKDRTTAMLRTLYEGVEGARVLDKHPGTKEVSHHLHHTAVGERVLLLGHGGELGLYDRDDDTVPGFDRLAVGRKHAFYLRKLRNTVAVFCHADRFARSLGLHGLFTGMIVSELEEADEYGVPTTAAELERETLLFAQRLRALLDADTPFCDIPQLMRQADKARTPLTTFNYQNIHCL